MPGSTPGGQGSHIAGPIAGPLGCRESPGGVCPGDVVARDEPPFPGRRASSAARCMAAQRASRVIGARASHRPSVIQHLSFRWPGTCSKTKPRHRTDTSADRQMNPNLGRFAVQGKARFPASAVRTAPGRAREDPAKDADVIAPQGGFSPRRGRRRHGSTRRGGCRGRRAAHTAGARIEGWPTSHLSSPRAVVKCHDMLELSGSLERCAGLMGVGSFRVVSGLACEGGAPELQVAIGCSGAPAPTVTSAPGGAKHPRHVSA